MKKLLVVFFLLFTAQASFAYRYHLEMPLDMGVYMVLAHEASDSNKSQRVVCSRSFHAHGFPESEPQPDWGCKGLGTDDPYYRNSSLAGMQAITADSLTDEGLYALYAINAETNAVETYIDVISWPGLKESMRFPVVLDAEAVSFLGYLPGKKKLGMQVVSASQNKNYYVKMKCVIDPDDLAEVIQARTNQVYTSFEFGNDSLRWHALTFMNNMKVSKNRLQLSIKAGNASKAKVNCKTGVVNVQGIAKQYLQDYNNVRFFMNINDYSDVDIIWFDHKRKYSWNRDYKPHYK